MVFESKIYTSSLTIPEEQGQNRNRGWVLPCSSRFLLGPERSEGSDRLSSESILREPGVSVATVTLRRRDDALPRRSSVTSPGSLRMAPIPQT